MPNGGEHHERLGVCPSCGSPSIRIRRQRHRHLLWRCRNCNRVFRTPDVAEYIIPAGDDGSGYIFAESIPEMERRGGLHERRGVQHGRSSSVSRKLTAVAVAVLLLGVVGYSIFIAGLGRDSGGPDQRRGSTESPVATDLQSPTPRITPPAANTPTPSPPPTVVVAKGSMATVIQTATPTATSTVHPSPTPELVPTATNTPTPSPPPTTKTPQSSNVAATTPTMTATPFPTATATPSPSPTQIPGRADLYDDIAAPDHLAYAWWDWNRGRRFGELVFDFTIHNDPGNFSDSHGLYLMVCFGRISNHNFYFGLQTNVYDPNQRRGRGKGLIFSRWGERDLSFARVAGEDQDWSQSSGHEGDFIGVRRSYNWGVGDYQMRLAPDGTDNNGMWYGVWITDLSANETTWAGSLKFPLIGGGATVRPPVYSTLEIYGRPSIRPIDIPEWHVSMRRPMGDGIRSRRADLGYSGVVGAPVSNSDVQYDHNTGSVHFRVGGATERIGPAMSTEFPATGS